MSHVHVKAVYYHNKSTRLRGHQMFAGDQIKARIFSLDPGPDETVSTCCPPSSPEAAPQAEGVQV